MLLDRVTWQIDDGERVGLCGPNGAGKTTLLRMLARDDEPDAGAIVTPANLTIGYLRKPFRVPEVLAAAAKALGAAVA